MKKQLQYDANLFIGSELKTIYFGGGTPSVLPTNAVGELLDSAAEKFTFANDIEITLEANPQDIDIPKLRAWKQLGINRLSIGVQSLNDNMLKLIGRRHDAQTAINAVRMAQNEGFDNISVDLIYALPNQSLADVEEDVGCLLKLDVQHISTYCLTYEEGTLLTQKRDCGELVEADDELANQMYDMIVQKLHCSGFERYEVSNFAKSNFHSRHNSAYWKHIPYLGIGASAHSFLNNKRWWNIANINAYIDDCINTKEYDDLSDTDLLNEKIMLGLRTAAGIELSDLLATDWQPLLQKAKKWIDDDKLVFADEHLRATNEGFHLLNMITTDLMA